MYQHESGREAALNEIKKEIYQAVPFICGTVEQLKFLKKPGLGRFELFKCLSHDLEDAIFSLTGQLQSLYHCRITPGSVPLAKMTILLR